MSSHISKFEIKNFKKFDFLRVENIGQFNLIVGDNNIGKTTLLESLLFSNKLTSWISDLYGALSYRDIEIDDFNEANPFDGFLNNIGNKSIEVIAHYSNGQSENLMLEAKPSSSLEPKELEQLNLKNLGRNPYKYSAVLYRDSKKSEVQFLTDHYENDDNYLPFVTNIAGFDDDLIEYYTENIQRKRSLKDSLIRNLALLIPGIENIEMSGNSDETTFLVTVKNEEDARIINQYGEGTIKLFRILLEIYMARGNRLMIDEFGVGIHYSRLEKFFELVISDCLKNNVQLFATTHSKECIEYFASALNKLNLGIAGRVIKLSQTAKGIRAYTNTYEQFLNALSAESEIR